MTRASWLYRTFARGAFTVFDVQRFRIDASGTEHLPRTGGSVLAVNHTSFWDFFAAGRWPHEHLGRPARILAKDELFHVPAFGAVMRSAGHIPVVRGDGRDAYEVAVERLREGELVLVLPEQTHSTTFDLLPFKTGAARMAAAAQVPLVPCIVWGIHRFHTTGRPPRWSWRLPVTVRYGPPLRPQPGDDPVEVTAALRAAMQAMLDEAVRSYPDGVPADAWWVPPASRGEAPSADDPQPA